MAKSEPTNRFKLLIRILAGLVLLCCIPFLAITFLLLWDFGGFIIGIALCAYFAFSILPLFGEITPDRLKRFSLIIGVLLWMVAVPPLSFAMVQSNPPMRACIMFLIVPSAIIGFYLLLSRILLYFAEKQGSHREDLKDSTLRLE